MASLVVEAAERVQVDAIEQLAMDAELQLLVATARSGGLSGSLRRAARGGAAAAVGTAARLLARARGDL